MWCLPAAGRAITGRLIQLPSRLSSTARNWDPASHPQSELTTVVSDDESAHDQQLIRLGHAAEAHQRGAQNPDHIVHQQPALPEASGKRSAAAPGTIAVQRRSLRPQANRIPGTQTHLADIDQTQLIVILRTGAQSHGEQI